MQKTVSTRRVFLQKGLTLLAVAPTIPTFLDQTVMALADPLDTKRTGQPRARTGKILVVVQLSGGNDGLSTVVPYADDTYHRARQVLGPRPQDRPQAQRLHRPATASSRASRTSTTRASSASCRASAIPTPTARTSARWTSGRAPSPSAKSATSGWLGRYFDNTCPGCDPHVGVSIGETLPLAMQGERVRPLSFERPENYRYRGGDQDHYLTLNQLHPRPRRGGGCFGRWRGPAGKSSPPPPASSISSTAPRWMRRSAATTSSASPRVHQGPGEYPQNEFGSGLKTVAAMIAGGLPTRVYYVAWAGSTPTPASSSRHDALMKQLSDGVSAFWNDLKAQGNDDRVLMMTFSEFGRRVEANATGGTDHGAAAPMFLMGKGVREGVIGDHPSLTNLDHGDLHYLIDFRTVYATILQDWLKTPSKPILGQQFQTMPVLRA